MPCVAGAPGGLMPGLRPGAAARPAYPASRKGGAVRVIPSSGTPKT
ncbi:hypothetical protein [Roseomonas chloroacetimidivorans]